MGNTTEAPNLSKELVEKIAAEMRRERLVQKKQTQDHRLHNTKLLLKKYRQLKAHIDTETPKLKLTSVEEERLKDSDFALLSVIRSKAKSKQLMMQVDAYLDAYRNLCSNQGKDRNMAEEAWRRYMVIDYLYTGPKKLKATEIAELYHYDVRTVYKDCNKAINELSVIFFGVDAIFNDDAD